MTSDWRCRADASAARPPAGCSNQGGLGGHDFRLALQGQSSCSPPTCGVHQARKTQGEASLALYRTQAAAWGGAAGLSRLSRILLGAALQGGHHRLTSREEQHWPYGRRLSAG